MLLSLILDGNLNLLISFNEDLAFSRRNKWSPSLPFREKKGAMSRCRPSLLDDFYERYMHVRFQILTDTLRIYCYVVRYWSSDIDILVNISQYSLRQIHRPYYRDVKPCMDVYLCLFKGII